MRLPFRQSPKGLRFATALSLSFVTSDSSLPSGAARIQAPVTRPQAGREYRVRESTWFDRPRLTGVSREPALRLFSKSTHRTRCRGGLILDWPRNVCGSSRGTCSRFAHHRGPFLNRTMRPVKRRRPYIPSTRSRSSSSIDITSLCTARWEACVRIPERNCHEPRLAPPRVGRDNRCVFDSMVRSFRGSKFCP
jgi:hypothetical protein